MLIFMATKYLMGRALIIIYGKIHTEDLSVMDMYKTNSTESKFIKQKPYARSRNRQQELISRRLIHLC